MERKNKNSLRNYGIAAVVFLTLVLMASIVYAAGIEAKVTQVASQVICAFARAFRTIVTGIAALVFVLAGVKWTASENDPGARKAAKDAMIHAVIGMLIILIIGAILTTVNVPGTPNLCGI